MDRFLVTEPSDMKERGWAELDFVLISGDAYVDHPSFAPAVIGRYLESKGYRVGIIDQPDWNDVEAFKKLGKPRLASLVTAGNLDSMLNKFTAAKKIRRQDDYSPGGEAGHRPDRATLVYANRMKEAYSDVPLIIDLKSSCRLYGGFVTWQRTFLPLIMWSVHLMKLLRLTKWTLPMRFASNMTNKIRSMAA